MLSELEKNFFFSRHKKADGKLLMAQLQGFSLQTDPRGDGNKRQIFLSSVRQTDKTR